MPNTLTLNQITSLRLAHRQLRDKRSADRIKAVYMWYRNYSFGEISEVLFLDETTLRRYVEKFKESGIDGLLECHYTGGESDLTTTQTQELGQYLVSHIFPTSQAVIKHIERKYQIKYSPAGVTKLLHRLGFSYKRPKTFPGRLDPVKQEMFVKEYHKFKQALKPQDSIHFLDASHPTHNTTTSYGWIKRGRKGDKFLSTNTGRERLNLNGALNQATHQVVVLSEKTINAQAVIKLLNKLIKQQPHGKIHLILDNAMYYRANIIKEWRKHHTRVKFHFLPPYSPNLNLIERLWLFFHRKITNNHYFSTPQSFKRATLYFFHHLDKYETELTSLLTDSFQTFPIKVANLS
jgi:transposase